jgi:hypothetical protein
MARPGDELVDPTGLRAVFVETAGSSGGAAFSVDWFVPPGGRLVPLPHVHPTEVEVFEIVAGRARYRGIGLFRDPLQSAITLHDLLFAFAYLPWLAPGAQETLIGRLADVARGRGYDAYVAPQRSEAAVAVSA